MSDANKVQVAGNHYKAESEKGNPQHWDLAIMYGWDPFQYQVTKYIMRWKTKHDTSAKKLEDLKKARHFLDKYIENYERYLPAGVGPQPLEEALKQEAKSWDWLADEPNGLESNEHWSNEGYYGNGEALFKCTKCKSLVRMSATPPPHGCTPAQANLAAPDASQTPQLGAIVGAAARQL